MDSDASYCNRNVTRQDTASLHEIFVPPAIIFISLLIGLLGLYFSTRRDTKKRKRQALMKSRDDPTDDIDLDNQDQVNDLIADAENFYSDFDSEVLDRLMYDYNNPRDVLAICLPSVCSLLLATIFVINLDKVVSCIWPNRGRPQMNTAVTCFLAPLGLVFALSFGFVFQQVLDKHTAVYDAVATELSQLDQMLTMTTNFSWPRHRHALAMLKAIKSELIILASLVLNKEPSDFKARAPTTVKVHIWTILDVLQESAKHQEKAFGLNSILVDRLVDYLLHINSICTDRMGALHTTIHPMKWLFLELLACIIIFGVMMIDTDSRLMELAMCTLTEFSCFMLFYLLADYDSPFNGVFRVTRDIIPEVVERSERLFTSRMCEHRVEQMRDEMTLSLVDKNNTAGDRKKRHVSRCSGWSGDSADTKVTIV